MAEKKGGQEKGGIHTEVQYGSSAGMLRSPESRKMPFLKTSFESLAPILAATRLHVVGLEEGV